MKKIVLCAGLMVGYTGLSYGMDITQDIAAQDWANIARRVAYYAYPESVQPMIDQLCATEVDLNAKGEDSRTLFEVLLHSAASEPSTQFPHKQANTRLVLKQLWKMQKIGTAVETFPRENEQLLREAIEQEIKQEIQRERDEHDRQRARQIFQRRCVISIPFAVAIVALVCAVYWWKTQKVDKDEQEEDANQDAEHAVVDVQIQNPVAV